MTKLMKTTLAAAVAASLGLGASAAYADALVSGVVQLENVLIQSGGVTLTNGTEISVLSYTQTANADVSLNAATYSSGPVNTTPSDIAVKCFGDCSGAPAAGPTALQNNLFPIYSTALGNPSSTFAYVDQVESGAPVNGITGLLTPATVSVGGAVSLVGNNVGDANANNLLTSQFTFISLVNLVVDVTYDAKYYLEAYVTPGLDPSLIAEFASGTSYVQWELVDENTGTQQNWEPQLGDSGNAFDLNDSAFRQDPVGGNDPFTPTGVKATGTFTHAFNLIAGHIYTLNGRMGINLDAKSIPEPSVMALLGLGLLGLGLMRRRAA